MLAVPLLVGATRGVVDHGFSWTLVPLTLLWFVGYFAYFAWCLWLKSKFQLRFRTPAMTYTAACLPLGAILVVAQPRLLAWLPAFAVALSVGLACAFARKERSVLSGGVMVAAAALMTCVAYSTCIPAGPHWLSESLRIWPAALLLGLYFFGTVLYVKTMIRERGQRGYVTASVLFHAACVAWAIWLAVTEGGAWWAAAAFFAAMLARAWWLAGRKVAPKVIGIGEAFASIAITVIAVGLRF